MSSEVHKYIETALEKKENLLNAELINFPKEKKTKEPSILEFNNYIEWKLYDKSNASEDGDQLRAVVGICLMFTVLILIGLYSSLV